MQAKWKGSAKMYNGVVTGVNEDGTFAVKFDDGDFDPAVPRESMVPREITIFDVAIMHRYRKRVSGFIVAMLCTTTAVIVRRQFTPSSRYSIYPFRPTLFGTPFIIRVQPDLLDGPELYNLVLSTVKRYIRCQLPIPDPPSLPQARSSTTLAGGR